MLCSVHCTDWSTLMSVLQCASKGVTLCQNNQFKHVSVFNAIFMLSWYLHIFPQGTVNSWWIKAHSRFTDICALFSEPKPRDKQSSRQLHCSQILKSGHGLRHQVSHPYKTARKIIILCNLTLKSVDNKEMVKGSALKSSRHSTYLLISWSLQFLLVLFPSISTLAVGKS